MSESYDEISAYFAHWVSRFGNKGAIGEVAQWLAVGSLDPEFFDDIVRRHGSERERWFRDGLLDMVLGYAQHRLGGEVLTVPRVSDIRLLRMALHVNEEEFFERRPAEIAAFLQEAFESILADGVIETWEDLYLVEVQAAFGLSYDQLLILARPALERVVADLECKLQGGVKGESARSVAQKLHSLEPTYLLAARHQRRLGALF